MPPNRTTPTSRLRSHPRRRECAASSATPSRTTAAACSGIAQRIPGVLARAATGAVRDPLGTLTEAARTTRSVARTLAPATGPMSSIMLGRGLGRRLEVFDIPLDDMRRAAKACDASLNDVFVAAVVGGVRRYHEHHGAAPIELRMTLPINLRQGSDDAGGNRFAPRASRFRRPSTTRANASPRSAASCASGARNPRSR